VDLEGRGMRREGIKGRDRGRLGGSIDDLKEVVKEELAMEHVRAFIEEVFGAQAVGAQDGDARKVGIVGSRADLERERWGEG
jgi:hypothetical protein